VDYGAIEKIIGEPYNSTRSRSIIQRALHRLVYEHELGWRTVRKIGILREDSPGVVKGSTKNVPAIRRKVLRDRRFLKCARFDELQGDDQTQYILVSSMLGVLLTITAPRFIGRLEVRCVDAANQIPPRKVMELFLKTDKAS
jgi:hypothetical protein